MSQLYQILKTNISQTKNSRPFSVDVDDLVNYTDHYIYAIFDGSTRPVSVLVSELELASNYFIYGTDEEDRTVKIDAARCFSSWEDRMIRSYLKRNPEQHRWYKTVVVDTIEERDRLQYDPDFEPESYVWVRNGQFGPEPEEYILTANRQFWVDIQTYSLEKPSGVRAIEALYERLSSGYLLDTFGPLGQNRTECDFVHVTYVNSNLTARTWTKTGSQIRWDFGDQVLTAMGVPARTHVEGNEIATFSTEDSFSAVSYYYFRNFFRGAFPSLDFTNVTNGNQSFQFCFCGPIPKTYDVSNITNANAMFQSSTTTSLPDMNFNSLTGLSSGTDIFGSCAISEKTTKTFIKFPNSEESAIFQGVLFGNLITDPFKFEIQTANNASIPLSYSDNPMTEATILKFIETSDSQLFKNEDIDPYATFRVSGYQRIISGPYAGPSIHTAVKRGREMGLKYPPLLSFTTSDLSSRREINLRHIPYFPPEEFPVQYFNSGLDTLLARYAESSELTSKSITNLLRTIYESRLENKTKTSEQVVLNLQPFNPKNFEGEYRNVPNPKLAKEFLYKLVENPDQEDINEYIVLYPSLDTPNASRIKVELSYVFDTTTPNEEIIFNIKRGKTRPSAVEIDYGDGVSEKLEFKDISLSSSFLRPHMYGSVGEYRVNTKYLHSPSFFGFSSSINNNAKSVTINTNMPFYGFGLFNGKSILEHIHFNSDRSEFVVFVNFMRDCFRDCTSLKTIDPFVCNISGDANNMFLNTGNIESVVLLHMNKTFSIANNKLNGEALNALFEGLATVTTPQTITVTGNPGILESTYDPTIATSKGWTVVDS